MITIVIKGDSAPEDIRKYIDGNGIDETSYRVISEEEYIKEQRVLKDNFDMLLQCPEPYVQDLSGYMAEHERKEKKYKTEQEKLRRKFSNRIK